MVLMVHDFLWKFIVVGVSATNWIISDFAFLSTDNAKCFLLLNSVGRPINTEKTSSKLISH